MGTPKPRRGRHGKPTSWWIFAAHLMAVFACTVGMMWAFSSGIIWLGALLSVGWLGAFALTSVDDVRVPLFQWVAKQGSHLFDRVRRMGDNKRSENKGEREGT